MAIFTKVKYGLDFAMFSHMYCSRLVSPGNILIGDKSFLIKLTRVIQGLFQLLFINIFFHFVGSKSLQMGIL